MLLVRLIFLGLFVQLLNFYPSLLLAQNMTEKHVGIFVFRLEDAYISEVTKFIEKELEAEVRLSIFDARQDQVNQFDQLNKFLNSGGDAVAMNLVDVKVGQRALDLIKTKNIPVIFFNKEPDLKIIKEYPKARYVGSAAKQSAQLQGKLIARLWKDNPMFDRNNDQVCNYIMLQGGIDNPEALVRSKLSIQVARKAGINMSQVGDTIICDWDAECAYGATKIILSTGINKVDMIISNNDSMALGAIKALQDYNFNVHADGNIIPVVGIDNIKQAHEAITKGIMHGTIFQDAQAMGVVIGKMLLNVLNDKPFLYGLPYAWDDNGVSIRIPYAEFKQ